MYSMYVGKFVSSVKEFYNEINAATLTGAIDVIVVEQQDGTFTCSPFHVRFGKMGVLRSREKVVDIEINGEPQDIHMKLGESGEAFFVEEVNSEDTDNIPEHLATSPIPTSEFENLYINEKLPRRNSFDSGPSLAYENQVNDYSQRRYTDGEDKENKTREFLSRHIELGNIEVKKEADEPIFAMDNLDEVEAQREETEIEKVDECPVVLDTKLEVEQDKSEGENKNGKKKRRKKSLMKKKNSQRKTSVTNMENIDASDSAEQLKVTESTDGKNSDSSCSDIRESAEPRKSVNRDPEIHFFSDTELTTNGMHDSRPNTPVQSDTEFEVSQRKEETPQSTHSWDWGQLPSVPAQEVTNIDDPNAPNREATQAQRNSMLSNVFSFMKQTKRIRHAGSAEGIYLADLSSGTLDPEVTALYFPGLHTKKNTDADADMDCESGNGTSLPQSPSSVEGNKSVDSDFEESTKREKYDISLSLCGWHELPTEEAFSRSLISYADLCNNPSLLESADLVVKIADKYYTWRAAAPIITSMLVFQRPLPQSSVEHLLSVHMPSAQDKSQKTESRGYSWWSWRRKGSTAQEPTSNPESSSAVAGEQHKNEPLQIVTVEESTIEQTVLTAEPNTAEDLEVAATIAKTDLLKEQDINKNDSGRFEMSQSMYGEKYRKTLRLTSDQIVRLNLKQGMNEVEFSVTTAYQGTTRCKCYIYRWRWDDKVVISDIDGTITKSDVLGHILPVIGNDWAQSGVAQLFTKIKNNGYKLLYLSARAIGQAKGTREYLQSIKQDDMSLPDGPLLLNPTSLLTAFHREVIEKKPEQFKISCLSDIQALFPVGSNPFYAGYGNRINDVWAYRAVGIPIVRIFTINHKGELKHELTQTFQSSYSNMTHIVDQMFPPLREAAADYSNFVYWREPIARIEDSELVVVK